MFILLSGIIIDFITMERDTKMTLTKELKDDLGIVTLLNYEHEDMKDILAYIRLCNKFKLDNQLNKLPESIYLKRIDLTPNIDLKLLGE